MPVKSKDVTVKFRCTEEFKTRLEDLADAREISVSRLIREALYASIKYRETRAQKRAMEEEREQ